MRAACAAPAGGERGGSDAPAARHAAPTPANQNGKGEHQRKEGNATWQQVKDDLTRIKEGLEKEKGVGAKFAQELSKVIARVPHALGEGEKS